MAKDQANKAKFVAVTTVGGAARFCRAGLCFGPEPTVLALADLGEGVLEALRAEAMLSVQDSEGPAPLSDAGQAD